MTLMYLGVCLPNLIQNPLKNKLSYCSQGQLKEVKISHDEYEGFLTSLRKLSYIEEVSIVSTCNRFEIVLHINPSEEVNEALEHEITSTIQNQIKTSVKFNCLYNEEAKLQILRTYCGLNSGLVGEDEICFQIKTSFKQSVFLGIAGPKTQKLLEDAIEAREIIDKEVYQDYKVSYCDIAVKHALDAFGISEAKLAEMDNIVVLGSGNTSKKSCQALLKHGARPESVTVVHRISFSSVQIEEIKACQEINGANFVRSKDGYRTQKVKDILEQASLVISGIDTRSPIIEFSKDCQSKIIDFNTNPSCSFEQGFDLSNYSSNLELDSYVRHFASIQVKDDDFMQRINKAEETLAKLSEAKALSYQ